jgi:uncharacterized phage protein gp47/JayE
MSEINFPTREELNQSSKVDIRSELLGSNPFLRNSWIGSIAKALAFRMFDFYEKLKELLRQFFWDTAEIPYMDRWASIFGIQTKAASQASGYIVAQGTPSSVINNNSKLSVGGVQYKTTLSKTILADSLNIISATWSASTVTIQTASNHNLASGINVTIAGMTPTGYNGVHSILVTAADEFSYPLESDPTPATVLGTVSFNTALIPVQADDDFFGSQTNQDPGTAFTFTVPIAGVNNQAFADFNGLTGGADQESTEDKRIRFLFRVQNPVANFNVAAIINKALEVPGNTRIWVREITPEVGQVTIYFTRDNDGIIPTNGDVTNTKNKILEIKPANTADDDVKVFKPTPKTIDFIFASLSPNTSTMQSAINANLDVFFEEKTETGRDVTENEYLSAIQNTIDTETGNFLISFSLTTPSGNISVASGELPVKGTVTFP